MCHHFLNVVNVSKPKICVVKFIKTSITTPDPNLLCKYTKMLVTYVDSLPLHGQPRLPFPFHVGESVEMAPLSPEAGLRLGPPAGGMTEG